MKLSNYTVHSVSEAPFTVSATVGGKQRDVSITGLIVEIVSEDGSMSHTLKLTDDLDAARALFVVGANVTLTVSGSK